ncbi:MAG TPA: amino-acid N-acetyltransferase [Halieaceae bacterium]|uniref:amino-acid N-acetyltransferase n=2 Tax=Haliea TaxID=475794 RepID=UPI000C56ADE5|nr:amino-acid N-acetyltransferase [Haliea sp.]HAN68615.1 amino-acid N-acetyltransferase [Halieaceae bacterium]MAD63649.1 amino-acid N-acetyltransferase [Haliea sp.]MAY92010.1 amino-acid N-acetyltransferase [Haliea sp.]MBK41934.1 amino-acid N-acetyltransferase [Haliea sp.]MBP70058.1 amino-acid N-acetyltransferase [Haliea sp.]
MTTPGRSHIRWFRNTAPYINTHRNRTFVLMLGGDAAQDPNFPTILHDLALLHSLGVRLVLVHGNRPQIDNRLAAAGIESRFHDDMRITDSATMHHVTDAAASLRAQIEALLSMGLPNSPMQGARMRVCSGNFVTARPLGVVDGVDFQHTGRVRRIDSAGIQQQLAAGSVVLLSPLGYSPTGEIFNLMLEDIAVHCAAGIGADKLVLFGNSTGIAGDDGVLLRQLTVANISAVQGQDAEQTKLLATARRACVAGVARCHIISYRDDCALLEELFTHDGNGTLVAKDDYEQTRSASIDDVGGILELIEPLEREGVLLKRSRELLENEIRQFRIIERDGRIIACAALYPFPEENCGEVACIVSHPDYRGGQRGQRLLQEIEREARVQGLDRVFVLTTQTAHWFLEQGFEERSRDALPAQKQALYNLQRNSKVFFKSL